MLSMMELDGNNPYKSLNLLVEIAQFQFQQTSEEKVRYNKLCSHVCKAREIRAESMEKYIFFDQMCNELIEVDG